MLIEPLVGSAAAERVLLYLANYGEGYAAGIARTFGLSGSQVQKQLDRFEQGFQLIRVTVPLPMVPLLSYGPIALMCSVESHASRPPPQATDELA